MNNFNIPIYNYLRKYAEQKINVFHMPGHKQGKGFPSALAQNLLQLDVTEVEGTDNLHSPEGIIMEAQQQAAKAFGADKTFFLVNGSTCGIQAAIMSVCARGQKIIIGRDSHKAVASGLILSGSEPVFVYPEYNEKFGVTSVITPESIEKLLQENPDAAAVLITRPNYYGICSDVEKISSLVHAYNKILIVDEAHGAHFAFSDRLPDTALEHGADICIQSAHKTLPALTQGAYLHIKGTRVNIEKLAFNLAMLQTSSPSYVLMSYLDIAREIMVTQGKARLEELMSTLNWFKRELEEKGKYKVFTDFENSVSHDGTRVVVNLRGLGISGYHADRILREKFKTQVEMADHENLVFITTVADDRESIARLLETLTELEKMSLNHMESTSAAELRKLAGQAFTSRNKAQIKPFEAYMMPQSELELEESAGRICADLVTPYPPGIPLIYPGEIISENSMNYINSILTSGGKVNGIGNNSIIRIV